MKVIIILVIGFLMYLIISKLVKNEKGRIFFQGLVVGVMVLMTTLGVSGQLPDTLFEFESYEQSEKEISPKSEVDEEHEEHDEINDILDKIVFRFNSDDGRYGYLWHYKDQLRDPEDRLNVEMMTSYIESGEFQKLRTMMASVPEDNSFVKEVKINYMVPIYMSENNYKDALRIVLRKMKFEKVMYDKASTRFRFDMAYLLRYMYLNNGLEASKALVDELSLEYPNSDLSYIWFEITENNFGDIYFNGYDHPLNPGGQQASYLEAFIKEHPKDKFVDHAYYLLGDYTKIINDYPDSDLFDRAHYARGYQLCSQMFNRMEVEEEKYWQVGYEFKVEELDLLTNYFTQYILMAKKDDYSYHAILRLLNIYTWHFRETGDHSYFVNLLDILEDVNHYERDYVRYNRRGIARRFVYLIEEKDGLVDLSAREINILESIKDPDIFVVFKKALANNAFYNDELKLAQAYYDDINYGDFGYFEKKRLGLLNQVGPLIGNEDQESLTTIANVFKNNYEKALALKYYDRILAMEISDEEGAVLSMYKAYCHRELGNSDKMVETHRNIAENMQDTTLADDALAEVGVYHLLYMRDTDKARQVFSQVIDQYPESNAVNDAYNWIAWSYLKDKDYVMAYEAYNTLLDKFPNDKYGINALKNIKKIVDVYLSQE